ncbi:MAG: M20 family metallopeptidase [Sciscionella sp.]
MRSKDVASSTIDGAADRLVGLSHRIHANPELGFAEHQASQWVSEELERGGFDVRRGVAGLPTALLATAGSGPLVLGICCEYDALPDIGHACGHNVIAAAGVGAALGLAGLADELGITVRVFGTPAEEGGGGKILMLDHGVFEGTHAAMMVHPSPEERAASRMIAVAHFEVEYTGKPAHAAAYPQNGINAADALTIAQVGIGLLRQHILPGDRIHGIVTRGGEAPNIVPARTTAAYYVRAETLEGVDALMPRVNACFQAGAIATGSTFTSSDESPPYAEFRNDATMVDLYRANAESLGRLLPDGSAGEGVALGSTDMGNISRAMPAIHPMIAIECGDSGNHQPEFARHCASPSADTAIIQSSTAMAWTCIDLATDDSQRQRLTAT